MEELILFAKALSDPLRVRILSALVKSELCVCEMADAFEVSQSTLSTHLQVLRHAGLVGIEKRRTWIIYRLAENERARLEHLWKEFHLDNSILKRDLMRLERRVKLRVDGCCVVGFGALKQETHSGVN